MLETHKLFRLIKFTKKYKGNVSFGNPLNKCYYILSTVNTSLEHQTMKDLREFMLTIKSSDIRNLLKLYLSFKTI